MALRATVPVMDEDRQRARGLLRALPLDAGERPAPAGAPALQIQDLSLWYGKKQAVADVNLDIPERGITALIGPSAHAVSTMDWIAQLPSEMPGAAFSMTTTTANAACAV